MTNKQIADSIFFDMDGTLWDGVECYAQGFNDFFKIQNSAKRLTKYDLYGLMGMEEKEYLQKTLPEIPAEKRPGIYATIVEFQYEHIKAGEGKLFEGIRSGMAELSKKYKLFIVSNCARFTIKYFSEWAGIDKYLTATMAHGENMKSKNENIKYLIEKYSLKYPVYVGDTDSDREQARIAGIPFVFASYGFGKIEGCGLSIATFKELPDVLLHVNTI